MGYSLFRIKDIFKFFCTKFGVFLLTVGFGFLAYAHIEPFFLKFSYKEIIVPKKFGSFTVAQISDVHFQWPYPYVTEKKMKQIVDKVNSLDVDYVFMTGDYISRYRTHSISSYNVQKVTKWLSMLKAKKGVYAILGNNDRCAGNMIIDEFQRMGIKLLRNETVFSEDISITGITSCKTIDVCHRIMNTLQKPNSSLNILLSHEPDTASITHEYFDLQFSGHTHGGQCVAPLGIGPVLLPSMGRKFPLGLYQVGNMLLYVTNGIGISPLIKPLVRFNNVAEVAVLHIISE